MALFGRKRKQEEEAAEVVEETKQRSADDAPKKKKKARNERLSSVVAETVFDTVLSSMRSMDGFRVGEGDDVRYVGFALDTDEVGGLSKKTNRDETKGQLIESIKGGRIAVLVGPEQLEKDEIVFIPTKDTVEGLSEFESLFKDATFVPVLIGEDGTIERSKEGFSGWESVEAVAAGASLDGVLGTFGDAKAASSADIAGSPDDGNDIDMGDFEDVDDDDFEDVSTTGVLEPVEPAGGLPEIGDIEEPVAGEALSLDAVAGDLPEIEYELDEPTADAADVAKQAQQSDVSTR